MFDEVEPGKPRNWGWTICIIATISIFNISIFVAIRILLDSENEFDEPLIQGHLREDLTKFVGFFALTFCFGCWCCFCCAGHCMSWTILCHNSDESKVSLISCWRQMLRHTIVRRPTLVRRKTAEQMLKTASSTSNQQNYQDECDENILFDAAREKITITNSKIPRPNTIFPRAKVEFIDELHDELTTTKIGDDQERKENTSSPRNAVKEKKNGVNFLQVPSTVGIDDKGFTNEAFFPEPPRTSTQK